jgi:hypothetical protein
MQMKHTNITAHEEETYGMLIGTAQGETYGMLKETLFYRT